MAVVEVFALPAEGAGGGPSFHDQFVGFLETLPVVVRFYVMGYAFTSGATHPAGNQPSVGNHVDHGQLLNQPQGVVP